MSIVLNWALNDPDLNLQTDDTKAELALLARNTGLPASQLSSLDYEDPTKKILTDQFLAGLNPFAGASHTPYGTEEPTLGVHRVYFDTDFGRSKKNDTSYCDFIRAQSKIDYWGGSVYPRCDWLASCALALGCLNESLDTIEQEYLDSEISNISLSWATYHAHLVYELYEAL